MIDASTDTGSNLVFVVGCPRSGTTWLQRLLACHPRVRTGQESDVFDLYVGPQLRAWRREADPQGSGRGGVGLACYFREEEFLRLLKAYALQLLEPMLGSLKPGEIFVEKTPGHVLFISEITELLPESRFIHMLRDGRDVVASLLAASKTWGASWAPRSVRSAAQTWVSHMRAARDAALHLPVERYCEVRYEDLHREPLETMTRVTGWLGLAWSGEEIQRAVDRNRPEVARAGGGTAIPLGGEFSRKLGPTVREPDGFVRRARPGGWRKDLSVLEKIQAWATMRHAMAKMGYPWPYPL